MKNKKTIKIMCRIVCLLAAVLMVAPLFAACDDNSTPTKLSFKSALEYSYLKSLDGKKVTINGYLATSSPADGSFIFLMNMPFQSCPFCKPNTSELSNTMEVYPKKGQKFDYVEQAVAVVGTLEVASDPDKPFTDLYGYEFNFKIVDAEYHILRDDEISAELAMWQKLSSTDVITQVYAMYDYVNFLCAWPTYYVSNWTDQDGNEQPGYFLYAEDAKNSIMTDGAQFNYGYADGYFDDIISDIRKVDAEAFEDLCANVEKAKALAERALAALENGDYTAEYQHVDQFGTDDFVYTLNNGEEFTAAMDELYLEFSNWLAGWEL